MNKMSWTIKKAGNISNLKLENSSIETNVDDNYVQIRVKSIGLNFADIFAITGLYSATPKGKFIPGLEGSGEIIQIGKNVTRLKVGDKVAFMTRFGAFTDIIDIEEEYCYMYDSSWTFNEGASFLVQTITAWYALKNLGDVKKNNVVLINSAAGGVGIQAMRLTKALGARPIGLVRNIEKVQLMKELGFENVFVRNDNITDKLKQDYKDKIDVVLDGVGGKLQKSFFKLLKPKGRLVVFGAASFTPTANKPNYIKLLIEYFKRPKYDPMVMINHNKSIMGFNLIWLYEDKELLSNILTQFKNVKFDKPHIGHVFEFNNIKEAINLFQTGNSVGKVVIKVDQ